MLGVPNKKDLRMFGQANAQNSATSAANAANDN
jgi:hypothetical protein